MKIIVVFFLLLAGKQANAQYENLLHKTYAERRPMLRGYYINELLGGDEVKRLAIQKIVSEITFVAQKNNDEDLALEARLMQLHIDIKWHLYSYEVALAKLDSLRQVGIDQDRPWLKARTESIAALVCFGNVNNYELGFDYLYKLYGTIQKQSKEEFPEKQICFNQMGYYYYNCHDLTSAIKYLKEGIRETPKDPADQLLTETISLVGVCYRDMSQLDSAHLYFMKALRSIRFIRESDNQWVGIVNGYMGNNFYRQKNYAAARPCLQICIDTALKYNKPGLAGSALADMGAINLAIGNLQEAGENLLGAERYTRQAGYYKGQADYYKGWVQLYPVLARWSTLKGRHAEATKYLDSFLVVKDSMDRKFNSVLISRGTQRAELIEKKALEDENIRKKTERNFLIVFIVVLTGVSIYVYRSQRKKHEQKERIKNLELHQKQTELDFATTQLNDFAGEISRKNKRVEELQDRLGTSVNEEALNQLQQSTILTDEEWQRFRALFAQVHGGYLVRLKEKLPDLSPAETRFMVLAKLKFSNKEMAAALGISQHAVRITWSRLRKKINLPEEGSLEELVAQVS